MIKKHLTYKLFSLVDNGVTQFIIMHRWNFIIPVSASIYIARLSEKYRTRVGTFGVKARHLTFIYSWAYEYGYDLEQALFSANGMDDFYVQHFCQWLDERRHKGRHLDSEYINQVIDNCRDLVIYFVRRCSTAGVLDKGIEIIAHLDVWRDHRLYEEGDRDFDDLTDEEYEKVECALLGGKDYAHMTAVELRNYILWRLTWEFGLRIGEVLALRLEDIRCDSGYKYLAIVRINHRQEFDPRAPNQPRVKTRSRELGYLNSNSELPKIIDLYLERDRRVSRSVDGKVVMTQFLFHNYVFIAHDSTANPLSLSGIQKVAQYISRKSGVQLRWHRIRHSFFNRAYEEALAGQHQKENIRDLIYFGGWASEKSLELYTKRVTRERAKQGLHTLNQNRAV
ncbi:tyrosine-type recombinase/integrase [Pseudomonas abietaniphila]